jgi:hypothetical protein
LTGDNGDVSPARARVRFALLSAFVVFSAAACLNAAPGTGRTATPAGTAVPASGSAEPTTGPAVSGSAGGSPPSASAAPIAVAAASPSVRATPKPVATVKGTGFMDSKTFKLKAGTYLVRWSITSRSDDGCTVLGALHTPDGMTSVDLLNTTISGATTKTGQKTTGNLKAGTYLVTMATSCTWRADVYAQ